MKKRMVLAITLVIVGSMLLVAGVNAQGATAVSRGGLLYDAWWKVTGADAPTGDNPLWATQSTNSRSGEDTWRCKECHGWDYMGVDGAYGSGSHMTGFPGVYDAAQRESVEGLAGILKGAANADHDFSSVMDDAAINDLATFLKEGLIDDRQYIDYGTKKATGANADRGKDLYSTCSACHGTDGAQLNFGDEADPEYLGGLANDNPWETLHKARFGHPGSAMPSTVDLGWSVQDAVDVLAYAQTLPSAPTAMPTSGGSLPLWTPLVLMVAGVLTSGLGLSLLAWQRVRRVHV